MKIGIVQHLSSEIMDLNFEWIQKYVLESKEHGCSCVCFPECSLTGYFPENAKEKAISIDSPILTEISALAIKLDLEILIGFMERQTERFYITHGIFHPDGSTEFYHKTHLGKKEQLYFTQGDSLNVYTLSNGLRIGLQLCVETHFPDITQTLALKGAEVIFAPHAVPLVSGDREHIWNKYIPARAYDNRVYFACCNQCDENRFGGGCLVVDPRGEIVASHYESNSALITTDIDRDLIASYRMVEHKHSNLYYPKRRRIELY